jgi:hypothetical protein
MNMARQICQQPRDAMLADLRSALHGWHLPLDDALKLEAANTTCTPSCKAKAPAPA